MPAADAVSSFRLSGLALALLASVTAAAGPLAAQPSPRSLPVIGPGAQGSLLQMRVAAETYGGPPIPWDDLAAWADARSGDPMATAVEYVLRLEAGEPVVGLYVADADATRVEDTSRLLASVLRALGTPVGLRPLETLYFADHASPTVEISTADGRQVLALPVTRVGGRWLRDDHWESARPVQDLFGLRANDLQKGRTAPTDEPAFELRLDAPPHPLVLELADAGPEQAAVRRFVERAVTVAADGTDAEFLALWTGRSAERLQREYATDTGTYEGRRYELGELEIAAHLATFSLGPDSLVHYVGDGEGAVQALFLSRTPQGFALSDDLSPNLRNLLSWDRVERQIPDLQTETAP